MGSPTLAARIGIAIGVALVVALALTAAFVAIGIIGLGMVGAGSIALLLLVGVTILVGLALVLALGAGAVGLGLIVLAMLVVLLLGGVPAVGAALATVAFLILVGIVLALGAPLALSVGALLLALLLLPLAALALGAVSIGVALIALALVGIGAILYAALSLTLGTHRLPLALLGLGSLHHMPAIPFCGIPEFVDTVVKLKTRQKLEEVPKAALTNQVTLQARTASARTFLFGTEEDRSFHLDDPKQFEMGWTTFTSIDQRASGLRDLWSQALTDAAQANAQFWPNLARYAGAFGIPPLRKVAGDEAKVFKDKLGVHSGFDWDALANAGALYVMDFTIFGSAEPPTVSAPRFTPSTLVFLARDAAAQTFTPILIEVSNGDARHVYVDDPTDPVATSTWLYALQAAKTSATVWGIWLGHVYKYHIVTAAMQMTMFHRLPRLHPVRQVIGRQSEYLIPFDLVLLIDWSFPPPTSLSTSIQFLKLTDKYSEGRTFFQDDPQATLDVQGLAVSDFTTPTLSMSELLDLPALAGKLKGQQDPGAFILGLLSDPLKARLQAYGGGTDFQLQAALASELNTRVIGAAAPLDAQRFQGVTLSGETSSLLGAGPLSEADQKRLHRLLLQDAFPSEIMPMSWNLYPVARYLLRIHEMSKKYVSEVVEATYPNDPAVIADVPLQTWFLSAQDPAQGNVADLLPVDSKSKLKDVLASLIYRVTAHGISRMAPIANPALSFVANFPPCLEDSRLPDPRDPNGMAPDPPTPLSTKDLLALLPKTGTIGEMLSFLYAFSFTPPYKPFIPVERTDLSGGPDFEKHPFVGPTAARCDAALQVFRDELEAFIRFFMCDSNAHYLPAHMNFQPTPEQIHQWELNIET